MARWGALQWLGVVQPSHNSKLHREHIERWTLQASFVCILDKKHSKKSELLTQVIRGFWQI